MKGVILIVLDGFGISTPGPGNAIYLANPANLNSFFYTYPNTTLRASGKSVGLPAEEVGNTEVGHINLGAGKVVFQDLPRINMSIADGTFYKNDKFLNAVAHIKNTKSALHLIGLVGEGSVHSHVEHLHALLFFAKEQHVDKCYIHVITDGRDSPPKSAINTIRQLEDTIKQNQVGKIVTVMGRYFAMDRDRRWERTEKAYNCLTKGLGDTAKTPEEAITNAYSKGKTDEFIEPCQIVDSNTSQTLIKEGDAVIFFNFRIDRPRQLTKAFVLDDFEKDANTSLSFDPYAVKYHKTHFPQEVMVNPPFKRGEKIKNLLFVTMTEYEKNLGAEAAYAPSIVPMPIGRVLSENNISQLRLTESEKERFVTFYFNGQREAPFPLEDRIIVPSPKVPTYDLKPEMSAYELTNILISKIREQAYRFILVNFPNPDMVGHTGNIQATIIAIKTIDNCLGKIVQEAMAFDYSVIITADHGNAEQKINPQTGDISTEHTNNPVPFIFINSKYQGNYVKLQSGILADVAPTILTLLDIRKPEQMTGRNLIEELK
jgi:2,3-bisphosphoglycerate-independent phosphoglycerate mutase